MKDERNVRHHRAEGARWRPAALLLAAVLIAVSVPFFGRSVFADPIEPVNVFQDCSLTVESSGIDMKDKQNVVVDLYRVAYLTPDSKYDTYHWTPTSALPSDFPLPEYTDRKGWKAVTENLVDLILGTAPENQTQWTPAEAGGLADSFTDISAYRGQSDGQPDTTSYKITGKNLGEKIESIPSGFYMIIARGSNVDKYVCTHESDYSEPDDSETDDSESDGGEPDDSGSNDRDPMDYVTKTVTLATSEKYTYQFAAEMFALPTKDKETGINGEANTANRSAWIYDSTVVLKPEIRGRGGSLMILKDLDIYEYRKKEVGEDPRDIKDNATFVFEVTAYESESSYQANGNDSRIYHNFVTINYKDESGPKGALVEDLPVGAYVVVKEVYSGRSYTATVEERTTVIQPDDVAIVEFENKYDKRLGGGGSFVNNFKYTNENGWEGNRVDDNSIRSTVVKPFNKD